LNVRRNITTSRIKAHGNHRIVGWTEDNVANFDDQVTFTTVVRLGKCLARRKTGNKICVIVAKYCLVGNRLNNNDQILFFFRILVYALISVECDKVLANPYIHSLPRQRQIVIYKCSKHSCLWRSRIDLIPSRKRGEVGNTEFQVFQETHVLKQLLTDGL